MNKTECSPPRALRVLVADDHCDSADCFVAYLALVGFEAEAAYDGEEALARVTSWAPDVCVLDLEMPKMSGEEIARALRGSSPCPILIAVTGRVREVQRQHAIYSLFDRYVLKPVAPDDLAHLIRMLTAHRL